MSRQVIEMSVRGKQRRVYLESRIKAGRDGSSRAQVYVTSSSVDSGRTSVSGVYSVKNGQRRFRATGPNADLL